MIHINIIVGKRNTSSFIVMNTMRLYKIMQVNKVGHGELFMFMKEKTSSWKCSVLEAEIFRYLKISRLEKLWVLDIRITHDKIWNTFLAKEWQF